MLAKPHSSHPHRVHKKLTSEDEIDSRRARGEVGISRPSGYLTFPNLIGSQRSPVQSVVGMMRSNLVCGLSDISIKGSSSNVIRGYLVARAVRRPCIPYVVLPAPIVPQFAGDALLYVLTVV